MQYKQGKEVGLGKNVNKSRIQAWNGVGPGKPAHVCR